MHPAWAQLQTAFDRRDMSTWSAAVEEVEHLESLEPQANELERLTEGLSRVAPRWADQIRSQGGSGVPLTEPDDWQEAWTWRRADAWLRRLHEGESPEQLQGQLADEEQRVQRLMADLVSHSAWLRQIKRTTDEQRRSL